MMRGGVERLGAGQRLCSAWGKDQHINAWRTTTPYFAAAPAAALALGPQQPSPAARLAATHSMRRAGRRRRGREWWGLPARASPGRLSGSGWPQTAAAGRR